MISPIQEQLVGYLLDALDAEEQDQVEEHLLEDLSVREDLERLRDGLDVCGPRGESFAPPSGLAGRTCQFIFDPPPVERARPELQPALNATPHAWSLTDITVAVAVFVAVSALFLPALSQSRATARLIACQNNLRLIGQALTEYSIRKNDYFPIVPPSGNLAVAGMYGPTLRNANYLAADNALVCADSPQADQRDFRIPAIQEVQSATGQKLKALQQMMGGSYAYPLGYVENGQYRGTKNLRRASFALMADAPNAAGSRTVNHGGCGQNVLFEDEHVSYSTSPVIDGTDDDIYRNDAGQVAPGLHRNDSVLGGSATPVLFDSSSP